MPSILERESNFLRLYEYWAGESECPAVYHRWACISMVAACLSNRVWISKQIGAQLLPIFPNLYVLVLGPSGNYKSLSMYLSTELLYKTDYQPYINIYSGKISAESLYNELKPTRKNPAANHLYLLNDELAMCVGRGQNADAFIKSITGLYHGSRFRDRTRTFGSVILDAGYCLNWYGCTTPEWAVDCITRDAVQGGFFGRTNTLRAGYAPAKVFDSVRPHDWGDVNDWLIRHINGYYQLSGEYKRTRLATDYERNWYMSRPAPDDPSIVAVFKRERDMLLKLSLIQAIADGSDVIEEVHMQRADETLSSTSEVIPELLGMMAINPEARIMNDILDCIRLSRSVQHSQLLKYAWKKGVHKNRLAPAIDTWVEAGIIERVYRPRAGGGTLYRWADKGSRV